MAEDDHPVINLDKLVRRIALDISLLRWFAVFGDRKDAVLSAISLARTNAPGTERRIYTFLKEHCLDRRPPEVDEGENGGQQ